MEIESDITFETQDVKEKNVVSANKALLAIHGEEIFSLAAEKNCFVGYEAAVAGGIPIIKVKERSMPDVKKIRIFFNNLLIFV